MSRGTTSTRRFRKIKIGNVKEENLLSLRHAISKMRRVDRIRPECRAGRTNIRLDSLEPFSRFEFARSDGAIPRISLETRDDRVDR